MTRRELLPLMVAVTLLSGCDASVEGARCPCLPGYCCWGNVCRPESECHLTMAFVPKASDNAVFRVAFKAARDAQDELNQDAFNPHVDVKCVSPQSLDAAQQNSAVTDTIGSPANGLIVSCLDPALISPTINAEARLGIPVITYDSDCPGSQRMAFFGTDNEESARRAADQLVHAMFAAGGNATKSVAILTGATSAQNLSERVNGFIDQLKRPPNDQRDVRLVAYSSCNEEKAEPCGQAVENLIQTNSELDGLFITGLWGLQSACSCSTESSCQCGDELMPHWKHAAHDKLKTVVYDSLPFELALLNQGYVSALIGQNYRRWGHDTVWSMFHHLTQGLVVESNQAHNEVYTRDSGPALPSWTSADFGEDLATACDAPPLR
ncbi:MAG TPA: substrate-binding domain-containing protein [Polyangiaceae bacterium]|nr:substrate-binding domain-containing protein [Polyangiaceae bacterium]